MQRHRIGLPLKAIDQEQSLATVHHAIAGSPAPDQRATTEATDKAANTGICGFMTGVPCSLVAELAARKDRGELLGRALTRTVASASSGHRPGLEKSVDEVAHILDVLPATVNTRMFHARKKLAELVNGAEKVRC
jgi:hypothetical protein